MKQPPACHPDRFSVQTHLEGWELTPAFAIIAIGAGGLAGEAMLHEPWLSMVPEMVGGWSGVVWILMGLAITLCRRGAVIDRREYTLTRWWGLGAFPVFTKHDTLSAGEVQLDGKISLSDELSRMVYTLSLAGEDRRVTLATGGSEMESRRIAENLAGFLGVPLVDSLQQRGARPPHRPDALQPSTAPND